MTNEKISAKSFRVVTGVYSNDECPRFASFYVDQALLDKLNEMRDLNSTHGFSEVRMLDFPEWGPEVIADDLRLQHGELVVGGGGKMWFTAFPKNSDYTVESRGIDISDLEAAFESHEEGSTWFADDDNVAVKEWYLEEKARLGAENDALCAEDAGGD